MKRFLLRILCLLVFWSPLSMVQAEEASSTVEVKLKTWLGDAPEKTLDVWAPTQQIVLHIEVSTNTWFTSGTQIKGIEMPDVLVKQRNTFAVNYTERENGQTWSKQRWEITLYPQKSGDFTVPAAQVITQVADKNNQKKAVTLETTPMPFHVTLPSPELDASKHWFAASDVKVTQEWSDDETQPLKAGDSITRTIRIEANDSLSVLLPSLMNAEASPSWSAYPDAPQLVDKQNRSGYISERTESQTYVLLNGGDIEWPTYEFWWWNTKTETLEKVSLEGKTLHVQHTLASWLRYYAWELGAILLSLIATLAMVIWLKRYYQTHPTPAWFEFYQSLRCKEWSRSRMLLYRKLNTQEQSVALAKHSPEPRWQHHAVKVQGEDASRRDFVYLWRCIKKQRYRFTLPKALPDLHSSESSDS
ncbi:BatD family protein [Vibrio mimicus]